MLELLGWLILGLMLIYCSIAVFFITVPTFGEALFAHKKWYVRVFGAILWVSCIYLWCLWLSIPTFSVGT